MGTEDYRTVHYSTLLNTNIHTLIATCVPTQHILERKMNRIILKLHTTYMVTKDHIAKHIIMLLHLNNFVSSVSNNNELKPLCSQHCLAN